MRRGPRGRGSRSARRGLRRPSLALVAALALGAGLILAGARELGGEYLEELKYRQARDNRTELLGAKGGTYTPNANEVAWLTVEGTPIDYPVAQGFEANPGFYLTHDLWDKQSQTGCPYLDWRCAATDAHVLIYGHRVGTTNLQFTSIADAWQQERFDDIGAATLSTPSENHTYVPCLALKVDMSYEPIQRFSFSTSELRAWLESLLPSASATNDQALALCKRASKALTLATCSSRQAGQRERTLLVFVEAEP